MKFGHEQQVATVTYGSSKHISWSFVIHNKLNSIHKQVLITFPYMPIAVIATHRCHLAFHTCSWHCLKIAVFTGVRIMLHFS